MNTSLTRTFNVPFLKKKYLTIHIGFVLKLGKVDLNLIKLTGRMYDNISLM